MRYRIIYHTANEHYYVDCFTNEEAECLSRYFEDRGIPFEMLEERVLGTNGIKLYYQWIVLKESCAQN